MLNCSYSSAMPSHRLPDGTEWVPYTCFPAAYFMSGVRPIEMIVEAALSEQAPTDTLYNHFCMAELLQIVNKWGKLKLYQIQLKRGMKWQIREITGC